MSDVVKVEMRGDIALLFMNRPKALNAISRSLAAGIADGLVRLDADPAVKGVVLTGAGDPNSRPSRAARTDGKQAVQSIPVALRSSGASGVGRDCSPPNV